jgi:hypothetical protein
VKVVEQSRIKAGQGVGARFINESKAKAAKAEESDGASIRKNFGNRFDWCQSKWAFAKSERSRCLNGAETERFLFKLIDSKTTNRSLFDQRKADQPNLEEYKTKKINQKILASLLPCRPPSPLFCL